MKWGKVVEGLPIKPPDVLKELKDELVLIASNNWKEILESIKEISQLRISIFGVQLENYLHESDQVTKELNIRTIDLGAFMQNEEEILCKELSFIPGGSGILDYAFLKVLAQKYNCKSYLEIGTYIGESINILTDCCEKLYSITAQRQEKYSMTSWCRKRNIPDYSERLAYDSNIQHFYTDSKLFDFSKIEGEIDLFFIDGDHSFEGVYADSTNIFNIKKDNAIVVWHDFRDDNMQYDQEVVCAVKAALGEKFSNVYVTNNNLCGIYIPDTYLKDFKLKPLKYSDDELLFIYDLKLTNIQAI